MKKKTIIILVVVCVVLILIGVTGLCSATHSEHTVAAVSSNPSHYTGLEDVRIPADLPSDIKEYEGFKLSFNADNHTANWVAWELLGTETDGPLSRSDSFYPDPDVAGCPDGDDYRRSGYDRGHLCPAGDQKWSEQAMHDCFYFTNMTPQSHQLNNGAWKTLELKSRTWAQRDSALVIVAGPIYEATDRERIGHSGVRVPGAFFKAILAPYLPEPRAIAFVYPNMRAPGNMAQYSMSIDELEQLTGFDFFYNLPDSIEEKVERSASFVEWNRE